MLNELEWESLESRREQLSLTILYNMLKQNIYFPSAQFHQQTSLWTRQCHPFRLTEAFCNTDTFKYSFIPSTSSQWNQLPHQILDSDTVSQHYAIIIIIIMQ